MVAKMRHEIKKIMALRNKNINSVQTPQPH